MLAAGSDTKVLVLVPAYNEATSLGSVIDEINAIALDARILVVDDGSTDGTHLVAEGAGVEVLRLPFNLGVGGAIRLGLLFAMRGGYDAVVQIDGDGQHDATAIPMLLEGLRGADMVIGSRFSGNRPYPANPLRRLAMRTLARAVTRLCDHGVTDATSGFRAMGPRAIRLLARDLPVEYLGDTVEALVLARRERLVVSERPVAARPRLNGRPSHGPIMSASLFARACAVLFVAALRRAPVIDVRTRG